MQSPAETPGRPQFDVKTLLFGRSGHESDTKMTIGVPDGFEVLGDGLEMLYLDDFSVASPAGFLPADLFGPRSYSTKNILEGIECSNKGCRGYSGRGEDFRDGNGVVFSPFGAYQLHGVRLNGDPSQLPPPDASLSLEDCNQDGYFDGALIAIHCLGLQGAASAEKPLLFTRDANHVNLYSPADLARLNLDPKTVDSSFLAKKEKGGIPEADLYGELHQCGRDPEGADVPCGKLQAFGFTPAAAGKAGKYDCFSGEIAVKDWQALCAKTLWYGSDNFGKLLHPDNRREPHGARKSDSKHINYGKRLVEGLMATLEQLMRPTNCKPYFVTLRNFGEGGRAAIGGHLFLGSMEIKKDDCVEETKRGVAEAVVGAM